MKPRVQSRSVGRLSASIPLAGRARPGGRVKLVDTHAEVHLIADVPEGREPSGREKGAR